MADSSPPAFIAVGRIVGPHGVRGEIKVEALTDFPERFAPGAELWLEDEDEPCRVLSSRPHRDFLLLLLDCIPTRGDAEAVQGRYLVVPRHLANLLPEGEYYSDEIKGLAVVSQTGDKLGVVVDVWWTGANEIYVVEGGYGEILLPAIAQVVQEVDLQNQKLVVKLIPGLVPELDAPSGIRDEAAEQ